MQNSLFLMTLFKLKEINFPIFFSKCHKLVAKNICCNKFHFKMTDVKTILLCFMFC